MKGTPWDGTGLTVENVVQIASYLLNCIPAELPNIICALDPMGEPIRESRSYNKQAHQRAKLRSENRALFIAYQRGIQACISLNQTELAEKLQSRLLMFKGKV